MTTPIADWYGSEGELSRVLLENARDYAVFALDTEGRVLSWSAPAEQLLGYGEREVVGQPADRFYVPEDIADGVPAREREQALEAGRVEAERWHVRRDGSRFWSSGVTTPLRGTDGTLHGFAKVMRDMTEKKRAEAARRESAAKYHSLFESIDEGFCIVEVLFEGERPFDYRFLETNPAFERHTAIAGAVGRRMRDIAPSHEEHWYQIYGQVAITGEPARFQRPAEALGRFFDVYAFRVGAPEQRRVAILFNDISQKMQTETALRESELRHRTLLEATNAVTWSCPPSGLHVQPQPAWMAFTGQSAEEMLGAGWTKAVHPDDLAVAARKWTEAVERGEPFTNEQRVRRHDGEWRWMHVQVAPIRNQAGHLIEWMGMNLDITDRRRAEEALRLADRRKDAFLATLGHELRNPLAPIRNACAILKLAGGADPTLVAARELIDRQVSHLVRLVDDLLDVSRITRDKLHLQRERIELGAVLERALEVAQPGIDAAGQTLEVALPPARIALEADPVRLAQVFANLLNNASKYTPSGGAIRLTVAQHDRNVVVEVTDTGRGIPAEHLPHLFELFYQVPGDAGMLQTGLGIGLALAQGLVTMHGGRITARSAGPGLGSTFEVTLPVAAVEPLAPERVAEKPQPAGDTTGRVLVVDDQADVAESLAVLLDIQGIEVQTASDGLEALAVAEPFQPDLVLLDLGMPRLDGFETCRRLRAEPWGQALRIIAVTGWGQENDRERSAAAGFDAHWIKPVDPAAVLEQLESIRAGAPGPRDTAGGRDSLGRG